MVVWRTEEGRADVELDQLEDPVKKKTACPLVRVKRHGRIELRRDAFVAKPRRRRGRRRRGVVQRQPAVPLRQQHDMSIFLELE